MMNTGSELYKQRLPKATLAIGAAGFVWIFGGWNVTSDSLILILGGAGAAGAGIFTVASKILPNSIYVFLVRLVFEDLSVYMLFRLLDSLVQRKAPELLRHA